MCNPNIVPNTTPNPDRKCRRRSHCWKDNSHRDHQYHRIPFLVSMWYENEAEGWIVPVHLNVPKYVEIF